MEYQVSVSIKGNTYHTEGKQSYGISAIGPVESQPSGAQCQGGLSIESNQLVAKGDESVGVNLDFLYNTSLVSVKNNTIFMKGISSMDDGQGPIGIDVYSFGYGGSLDITQNTVAMSEDASSGISLEYLFSTKASVGFNTITMDGASSRGISLSTYADPVYPAIFTGNNITGTGDHSSCYYFYRTDSPIYVS